MIRYQSSIITSGTADRRQYAGFQRKAVSDICNANDTADRIEAYAKKSGMKVVETIFNTDKKAVERLRYYIERDVIICVLVRDVVDISMELNEIKAVMTLAAEHGISINAESRGYEPALISYE